MEWWYARGGKKMGPADPGEIKRLFQKGKINRDTLVWRKGLVAWAPMCEVQEMDEILNSSPPPVPQSTEKSTPLISA